MSATSVEAVNGSELDVSSSKQNKESWGLEFAYRLGDPLLPYEKIPGFEATGFISRMELKEKIVPEENEGKIQLYIFHPGCFTVGGENALNFVTDLSVDKDAKDLKYFVISTDSLEVLSASSKIRDLGLPEATFISDKNGQISQMFGVLDTKTHRSYNAIFLVDKDGVVQASRVSGIDSVQPIGAMTGVGDLVSMMIKAIPVTKPSTCTMV